MTSAAPALPHWDMTVVYPSLESPEFEQGFQAAIQSITELAALFDGYHIDLCDAAPLDDATVGAAEAVIERLNAVLKEVHTLVAYLHGYISTDSRNDAAQARLSELRQHLARLSHLDTRFTAWVGALDVEGLIERSEVARTHAFTLRKAKQEAAHLMSPEQEALAAELELTSGTAWEKLYDTFTSQLMVRLEHDGAARDLPMSEVRNLAFDADRALRRQAYEAELAAWEHVAVPIAAALNSIKGEVNTLSARRHWAMPLDAGLFASNIDRATLEAMMSAAREAFPHFRRYLRAKARALGLPALAWYDLSAPVGKSTVVWEYERATTFIVEQFGAYSARLSDFAARAFRERWIDAEPRPGKQDGGFCMSLREDESRILVNYVPAFDGMSVLAHELGHAYHNMNLAGRTMLQRATPMTLAETASIFCETIIRHAGMRHADEQAQIALLDAYLQSACMTVVDISSRFLFEQRVFERRRQRELSIDDFNNLMLEAQRETYGDGLDQSALHPYMWAVKSHYYSSGFSFYNYPYMFGLLFGLGLYARYQQDPEGFRGGYDDLLSSTGMADAATLAARFGIDIRTPEFWRASLDVIRADIDRFEQLVSQ